MILEIILLAIAIYAILRFLGSTRGGGVLRGMFFFGLFVILLIGVLSRWPGVPVLADILSSVTPYLVIVVAILFQPELRQGVSRFGRGTGFRLFASRQRVSGEALGPVVAAAKRMAKARTGALITFERRDSLAGLCQGAVSIDAPVSGILLESIFFPSAPLHDGAVVIRKDNVVAASVLLPLSNNPDIQRNLGTRHRAAIGVTEESDAITLVVSEETGEISLASNGEIQKPIPFDQLEAALYEALNAEPPTPQEESISSDSKADTNLSDTRHPGSAS
jgi:diadenylate cyclase